MPTFTAGASGVDFDSVDLTDLTLAGVSSASASSFTIVSGSTVFTVVGSGFAYGGAGLPLSGTITEVDETSFGATVFTYSGANVSVADINNALSTGDDNLVKAALFGGANLETGSNANDLLRGFAGDDTINGNDGDDLINAGGGNNTETGGGGADTFHSFAGAGRDVITDFNQAQGDRVLLDPGTNYTASQQGADTVVDMGNGDQVILQNVQLSSLHDGWIVVGT